MAGNKAGGKKAAATNLQKNPDFYRIIGRVGGAKRKDWWVREQETRSRRLNWFRKGSNCWQNWWEIIAAWESQERRGNAR